MLRSVAIDAEELLGLARQFGPPLKKAGVNELVHMLPETAHTDRRTTFSSITKMEWHSDRSFDREPPALSFLWAKKIGSGSGRTIWANLKMAFASLEPELQVECRTLHCWHELGHFAKSYSDEIYQFDSPDRQRIAFERSRSEKNLVGYWQGEPYLNINRGYTSRIVGRSQEFLEKLLARSEAPDFSYHHQWQTGDLVISNNWTLIHCREPSKASEREMFRVLTLKPTAPEPWAEA